MLSADNLRAQAFGQTQVDSVLQGIKAMEYDERRQSLLDLSQAIGRSSEDPIALFAYAESRDSSDLARMAYYETLSKLISRGGDTEQAIALQLRGLEYAKGLSDEEATLSYHISLGTSYHFQTQLDDALYHINEAEVIAQKEAYKDFLWNIFYVRGLIQTTLKDYDQAQTEYVKMYESMDDYPNNSKKRFALYILVDFLAQVDAPEALTKYTEILAELYEEANPNMPNGHMPIKTIFARQSNPSDIPKYEKVIRISDSTNSINSLVHGSIALAQTYGKMNQPESGIPYLTTLIPRLDTLSKPQKLLDVYMVLTELEAQNENYRSAFTYAQKNAQLRDSINSDRMQKNIAELEVKFETEQKERQIAEQELVIATKNRQKNQILLGLVSAGLLLIFSVVFFRQRLKFQQTIATQNQAIQQQEIKELQQQNKLLALNSMIEGQEAERLRIAKDLHDSLGGLLSTVKAHFSTIQKEIEQLEKLNITEKTNSLIDEACLEVRRISHNMMPHALSISGLQGAIEDAAQNLTDQGYQTTVEISALPEMESTREVMIYRLIQELLSNIRKHANAKTVLIQLLGHKGEIHLIIEDDGQGFDIEAAQEQGGLGLKSIKSRVEFLDGTILWDAQPGNGTSVTITLPKQW